MSSSDLLGDAIHLHQQGALAAAGRVYTAILAREPAHADALHLLGVLAFQRGDAARAVTLIEQALDAHPGVPEFYVNLAEAYRAVGRPADAVACGREALRRRPGFVEAANGLGLSLIANGQLEEAVIQLREAVALRPDSALTLNNLGHALRLAGDRRESFEYFRRAVRADSSLPEARANFAQALLEAGLLDDALEHATAAVEVRPDAPDFQNTLGNVLRALGWLDDALACYQRALTAAPGLARTHSNIGIILGDCDRLDEAAACFLRALSIDPRCAEALGNLGWIRHLQGRASEAEDLYRRALEINPLFDPVYVNLGLLMEELGDEAEAEHWLRKALQNQPTNALARARLATLLRGALSEADLVELRQAARDRHRPPAARAALQFGLAHVMEARRDCASAARELESANALRLADWRRRGLAYDPAAHDRLVESVIAEFTPEFFARAAGFGVPSERPVFVVGLPRSGTSLTEQILAVHPQVFGVGEAGLARDAFQCLAAGVGADASLAECLARLDVPTSRTVAERFLDALHERNAHARRVIDKTLENYAYLGLLAVLFPHARFIRCRRDRRDAALSCWSTDFRGIRWASDPDHIVGRFAAYKRLMDHWSAVLPASILDVDYEQTVSDLEGTARRLVAWCGLDWDPACLEFHRCRRPVHTASAHQVRQPVYTGSVGRWRAYEASLGPWFERLGTGPL